MYGLFDYFLVRRGEIFFNFAVKRIVGELSIGFLLVEVGAPNDYRATALMVMSLRLRRFKSTDHSSGLRLNELLLRLNLSLETSCRHFCRKKSTVANCPSRGVHLDLRLLSFSFLLSFFILLI